jgi:hypothetical protein
MDDIVISPPLPNQLPIAMINQSADEFNATITQGTAITLSADGSYDSDGNITACEWRIGNSVMVSRDGIHTCSLYNLTLQSVGTYVYTLSVTDNQGATTINYATIVVNAVDNGNTECTQLTDTHPTFTVAKNNILLEVSALFNGFNVDVTTNTDMTTTSTGTIAIYGTIDGNNTGSLLKLNGNYVNGSNFVVKVYKENTLVGIGNEVSYSGNGVLNFGTIQVKKCEDNTTLAPPTNEKITLSGKVTYDRVHVKSNYQGLDYNNITQENAQQVVVEAIDVNNTIVATTTTDDNGEYFLSELAPNQNIKIRVLAKMFKEGSTNWDVKVVDNTNSEAMYVMEGDMLSTGMHDSIRNLNASSTTRTAAPFALLDNVYDGMQKVMGVQSEVAFPPLMVNWSVNNKASGGNIINGDIGTSYYTNGKLFILGDASGDSDEYDDHVIAHEWGHYYEDKFSRTDSIGGAHGDGDHLDIRVAFGEGFGNAMSAIATDNPIYFDTFMYNNASNGWYMNIENGVKNSPGWFSESSIQRILYDLYDSNDDGSDHLSLGFSALHEIFIGAQKDTQAFTSIFSFITELKLANPDERTAVDNIVASESMATISDIYGSNRTNLSSETPLYSDVTIGGTVNVCTKNNYGSYNKLSNRKYIQFNVSNDATYTIRVAQSNGSNSDPDFLLYKTSPHTYMGNAESADAGIEVKTLNLSTGSYLLDISDYNNISAPCFNVTVNP